MEINCMTIHPGDYVLVQSFGFPTSYKTKVKAVYENYVIDTHDEKVSYHCLSGIPLDEDGLRGFGFLITRNFGWTMFCLDSLTVSVSHDNVGGLANPPSDLKPIVTIGLLGKGKTTSDLQYLHEVQHFYFNETRSHLRISLTSE